MNTEQLRKQVHTGIDQHCAPLTSDPYLMQRVLKAANKKGGITIRKQTIALLVAVVLMLLGTVAIAASLFHLHIEKAMDLAKDKGAFDAWSLDDKVALIETMSEAGIALPQEAYGIVLDSNASEEEKDRAATDLLTGIYGSEEYISYFTIASHDWGDPFLWSLEQKEWFWETLREKGLYTGRMKYLLPGDDDLSREQVVLLAKQAIQEAFDLSSDIVQGYEADVTFFTIEGTDVAPRWRVYLGYAGADAAAYAVLLTQDGQVTEDASLHIFNPKTLAGKETPSSLPASTVVTPSQRRMLAAEVFYLSTGNSQYHFLVDCPSAKGEKLSPATDIDGNQPCPYCVLQTQLWSAEDKIAYGVMRGELPSEDVIPAVQAEQLAADHLHAHGLNDVNELTPYSRYLVANNQHQYTVFFAQLKNAQIEPVYAVIVNADTGEIIKHSVLGSGEG